VFLTTPPYGRSGSRAQRIASIEPGRLSAQVSPQELKQQTGKDSFGRSFSSPLNRLTIRDEGCPLPSATRCADGQIVWATAGMKCELMVFFFLWCVASGATYGRGAQIAASRGRPASIWWPLGIRTWSCCIFQSGAGQLTRCSSFTPGNRCDVGFFSSIVLSGMGSAFGKPPVRCLKETLVAARSAPSVSWADPCGRHGGGDSRTAGGRIVLLHRWLSAFIQT